MNSKPLYASPILFGVKDIEINSMSANRYQGSVSCCNCTAHGNSRA